MSKNLAGKIASWAVIFSAMSAMTYATLSPEDGLKTTLAYAAEHKKTTVVLPADTSEREEKTLMRIARRINKTNLICTVNAEQASYLADNYNTETESMTVNGEEVSVLKVEKEKPSNIGEIRKYLRETGEGNCIVIPARNWLYLQLGAGGVS